MVVKASFDLTGKYPNTNIQRRAVGIAPSMPGRYNFKRLLKFVGLKKVKNKFS